MGALVVRGAPPRAHADVAGRCVVGGRRIVLGRAARSWRPGRGGGDPRPLSVAVARGAASLARRTRRLSRVRRRARGRAPAGRPARRPRQPRCGHVDHRRARGVRPLPPTRDAGGERVLAVGRVCRCCRRRVRRSAGPPRAARGGRCPSDRRTTRRASRSRRTAARRALVDGTSSVLRRGRGGARAHPGGRHLPGRAGPAVRPLARR